VHKSSHPFQILLFAMCMIFLHTGIFSQSTNEQNPDNTKKDSVIINPILDSDVPATSLELEKTLKEIDEQASNKTIHKTRFNVNALIRNIDSIMALSDTGDHSEVGVQLILSQSSILDSYFKDLKNLEEKLNTISKDFEEKIITINAQSDIWNLTKETKPEERAESITSTINESILLLNETKKRIVDSLNAVLDLQSLIGKKQSEVTKWQDQINYLKKTETQNFFQKDSPPMYQSIKSDKDTISFFQQIYFTVKTGFEETVVYFKKDTNKNPVRTFLLLIAIIAMLWILKRKKDTWLMQDESLEASLKLITVPYSTGIALFLFFTILFHVGLPDIVITFILILMLFPLLRIFPKMTDHRMFHPVLMLSSLFIINQLQQLLIGTSLDKRILVMIEAILAFVYFLLLYSPKGMVIRRFKAWWWEIIVSSVPLFLFVCFASIMLNFFGFFRIATLLISGLTNSLTVAVVMITLAIIVQNLYVLLLFSPMAQLSNIVTNNFEKLKKAGTQLIYILAFYIWINSTLHQFLVREIVYQWFIDTASFGFTVGDITVTVGDFLLSFFVIICTVYISKFIRSLLEDEIFSRTKMNKGTGSAIAMLVRYTLIIIGFFLAASAAGIDISTFGMIAGALSVGIGFGLQNVVANFIAGIILAFEQPIKSGDTVEVDTLLGKVREVGFRSSKIKTFDGAEVIVPNEAFISKNVINWTYTDTLRRIRLKVGVEYGTDPDKVIEILKSVSIDIDEIVKIPEPLALFKEFGESSLNFELLFWTKGSILAVSSEAMLLINRKLKEENIKIPYPRLEIFDMDKQKPKEKDKD
jgi:potassium-dependent mechanosensitive channel